MAAGQPEDHQERANRQRRLGDAAKLLPLVAALLMVFPTLWAGEPTTSRTLVYIFALWGGLIVAIALLSRRLARYVRQDETDQDVER